MTVISLETSRIVVNDSSVDPLSPTAAIELSSLLGSVSATTVAGVAGSGRTAFWHDCGVVMVRTDATDRLSEIFICFSAEDSSPYPDALHEVPAFSGTVAVAGHSFCGAETESAVFAVPGTSGLGGMLSVRLDQLFVGFELRKPRDRFRKRTGTRRLVNISAGWGGVKPRCDRTA